MKNNKGFTLIEVILTIMFLMFIMISMGFIVEKDSKITLKENVGSESIKVVKVNK